MNKTMRKWLGIGMFFSLSLVFVGIANVATAQESAHPGGVRFTAGLCASESQEFYGPDGCQFINGATFEVLINGVEDAGSPFTTAPGLVNGDFFFDPPANSDLTITYLSGAPDGWAPGPGFDPFTANTDDLTEGGCGGEASCLVIEFRFLPVDNSDGNGEANGDSNGDDNGSGNGDIVGLPNTGTGTGTSTLVSQSLLSIVLAAAIVGTALAVRKRLII